MTTPREYLDFTLELRDLDAQTDTFHATVLPSAEFGEPPSVTVHLRLPELQEVLEDLEDKRIRLRDLIWLGEQLAERLLPAGGLRELFRAAIQRAGRDRGVRLRLLLREPRLAQLPWEYSYLPIHAGEKDRNHFLAVNPQVSVVRHVPLAQEQPTLEPATSGRLRLLVVMANPTGLPALKLRRERKVIEEALRDFRVDEVAIEWEPILGDPTLDELHPALQQKADLFHFAGHGVFQPKAADAQNGEGFEEGSLILVKDKEFRGPAPLRASDLAVHLQNAGVRIAVLGACESGRQDGISPWTGVAPALMARGLPAVIAMQYEIEDEQAIALHQMFYTALASGLSVDEAVSAGRLAILGKSDEDDVEWGVPVLYMRAIDGIIFPRLSQRESETATQIRRAVHQAVETIATGGEVVGIVARRVRGSFEVHQKAKTVKGRLVGAEFDEL